ncbi:hypothetical protein HYH02_000405 [Chlamydomonas schloesseri]|uniref:Uncharacterized protein n=1 Tax=Chlamydomonas schloesseri TaxID=2026947 RepID=A0A835WYC6_9CHLO|nr:hypothetical protein HYH02_000405 [Chlamydomonas schloesseri]|eukprot:KAG2454560.1 hypothetical protein HYH02_000405 [Chlamydomonas schloesseri]
MGNQRFWDASLYIPAGLFQRCKCKCTPADYCCSACCKNCCECCDLRKSVLIAASWQFLLGGLLGATYAILTTVVLRYDLEAEGDKPVDLGLLIYLLAYWWVYFLSGVVGCCVTCDRQGILTYEQRVIVMCRGYVALSIVDALGHLNPVVFDRSIFESGLSRGNIVLTLVPLLWDSYIAYLAWSLLKKLKEQRKGLFRGKPVMRHQRKPAHIVELHTAHHLELQPPQGQIILPLAQLRLRGLGPPPHGEPGAGVTSASFLAGWLNQQGYSNYTADSSQRKGLRVPAPAAATAAAGGAGAGAATATASAAVGGASGDLLADGMDFGGDGGSSVWNMRDSSMGDDELAAGAANAVDLGFSDGRGAEGSFVSLDGTAPGPGSAVLDDSAGGRGWGREREREKEREKERDSGGDGRSRSVLGSGGGAGAPPPPSLGEDSAAGGPAAAAAAAAPTMLVTAAPSTITDGATALTAIEEEDPSLAALGSPQRPPWRAPVRPAAASAAQQHGPGSAHHGQHNSRHAPVPGAAPDAPLPAQPWDTEQLPGAAVAAPLSAHATQELDRRSLARSVASSTTAIAAVATATASAAAAAAANVAAWFNRSMAVAGGSGAKAAAAGGPRSAAVAARSHHGRDISPGARGRGAEDAAATPIFITGCADPSPDAGGAVFELRMYSSAALQGRQQSSSVAAAGGGAAGASSSTHDRFVQRQVHTRHAASLHHPHHQHHLLHHNQHKLGARDGTVAPGGGGAAAAAAGGRVGPSLGTHARSAAAQQLLPVLDPVVLPIPAAAMYGSALFGKTAAAPSQHLHEGDGGSLPRQALYAAAGVTGRAASVSVTGLRPTAASQSGYSGGDGSAAAIAAGLPLLQRAPSLQLPPPPGSKATTAAAASLRPAPSMSRRAAFMKQMSIQRARTLPRGGGATAAALEMEMAVAGATAAAGAGPGAHPVSTPTAEAPVASHGHGHGHPQSHMHRTIGAPAAPMVSPFARQTSAAHRGGAGDPAKHAHEHEPRVHSLPHPFAARAGQQPQQQQQQQQPHVSPFALPTPGGARMGRTASPKAPWSSGSLPNAAGAPASATGDSAAAYPAGGSRGAVPLSGQLPPPPPTAVAAAASLGGEAYLYEGGNPTRRSPQSVTMPSPHLQMQPAAIRTTRASSAYGAHHGAGTGKGAGAAGSQQGDAGASGAAGPRGVLLQRADGGQPADEQHPQPQLQQQFQLLQQQVPHVHPHQAHVQAAATAAALQLHLPAMRGRAGGGAAASAAAGQAGGGGAGGGGGSWPRSVDVSAASAATAAAQAAAAGRLGVDASLRTASVSTPKGQRGNRLRFFYSAFGPGGAPDEGAGEADGNAAAQSRSRNRAASTHDSATGVTGGGGAALVSRAVSNASTAAGSGSNVGVAATWAAAAAAAVSGLAHSWGAPQQQQQQDSLQWQQQTVTPITGNSTPVAPFQGAGGGGDGGAAVSSAPDVAPFGGAIDIPKPGDAASYEGTYNPVYAWVPATGQMTASTPAGGRNRSPHYSSSASGAPPAGGAAGGGPAAAQAAGHRYVGAGAPTRFAAQQQQQREQALKVRQQAEQQQPPTPGAAAAAAAAGAASVGGGTGNSGRAANGDAASADAAAGRAAAFASLLAPLQLPALAAAARGGAQSLYEGIWNYTSRAAAPPPQAEADSGGLVDPAAGGAADGAGGGRGHPVQTEIREGPDVD